MCPLQLRIKYHIISASYPFVVNVFNRKRVISAKTKWSPEPAGRTLEPSGWALEPAEKPGASWEGQLRGRGDGEKRIYMGNRDTSDVCNNFITLLHNRQNVYIPDAIS